MSERSVKSLKPGKPRMCLAHHRPTRPRSAMLSGRRHRGIALLELCLVIVPLSMIIFTSIDFGARARFQNRLRNAAREGAALAQLTPGRIKGCTAQFEDIEDRIRAQDPDVLNLDGYQFNVKTFPAEVDLGKGCDMDAQPVAPGDRVLVEVHATYGPVSPIGSAFVDEHVSGRAIVVVQG